MGPLDESQPLDEVVSSSDRYPSVVETSGHEKPARLSKGKISTRHVAGNDQLTR